MEGAHFAKTGELYSLSEQQLIDCDIHKDDGGYKDMGCNGGDYARAFWYFEDYSPTLESVYPYTSGSGDDSTECLYSASEATNIKVKDIGTFYNGSYEWDIKAVVQYQPVVVGISANNRYIHSYASGIIDAGDCFTSYDDPLNPINHAVLIVGYGHDEATGLWYWLIKNSWNTTWGDKGFVKIKMVDQC